MYSINPAIVEARNQLNANAMAAEAELIEILTPWLGRKIRKTSGHGGWVAKLEPVIREFADRGDRTWLTCQHSWLTLECQSMLQLQPHGVSYSKAQLSIGKIDETGVLLELFQPTELRTNYTATEIDFARARAFELEQQARDLRHSIREFER
jgi:hypothetical protein